MRKGNFAGLAASTKRKRLGKGTFLGWLLVVRDPYEMIGNDRTQA